MATTVRTTADSSSTQLYMAEEKCWGDDPTVVSPAPTMEAVRFTSESLVHSTDSVVSEEIRSDSQITDNVRVAVGAEGDVSFELSYRAFDRFFEGLLRADWTNEIDINNGTGSPQTTVVSVASPLNVMTFGSPGADLTAIQVGAFIKVSGSTTSPTNDGYYEVTANAGGALTISPAFNLPESGTNLRVQSSHLRNGTTKKSFLLEKRFTDVSPVQSLYFTGMRAGSGSLSVAPGEILTGSLSFLGKRGFARNGPLSDIAAITDVAAPAFDVANSVDNVSNILLDGAALDADLTELSFDVNNNTRDKPAVGVLGNVDIGLGRFNVEGNVTAYFADRVLYDKYLAFSAHSWSFVVEVGSNAYLFEIPSIRFTSGTVVAEGNDGDVVANMDWTARRDPTKGYTLAINRFSDDVGAEVG